METTDRDVPMQQQKNKGLSSSLPGSGSASLLVQLLNRLPELIANSGAIDGAADVGLAGSAFFGDGALGKPKRLQLSQHFLDGHSPSTNQVMYGR